MGALVGRSEQQAVSKWQSDRLLSPLVTRASPGSAALRLGWGQASYAWNELRPHVRAGRARRQERESARSPVPAQEALL